jgi:hypothetical protein
MWHNNWIRWRFGLVWYSDATLSNYRRWRPHGKHSAVAAVSFIVSSDPHSGHVVV